MSAFDKERNKSQHNSDPKKLDFNLDISLSMSEKSLRILLSLVILSLICGGYIAQDEFLEIYSQREKSPIKELINTVQNIQPMLTFLK